MKQQLRLIKKDSLSINDYILKIKTIGHALAAIRGALNDKDILLAILNGLDQEYDTVVSLITYQINDIDLKKERFLLLMHEQRLSVKNSPNFAVNFDSVSSMHVNVALVLTTQNNSLGNNNRGGYSHRGSGFINRGGRGRGRASNKRVYCQLCEKPGHIVD